ncbi:MAG: hypothetical protein R3Y12_06505 [Clostridia bacterium]
MKQSKPLIITVLMITLLLSSYVAFASEYGSKDDPLVSLSYIKEILLPQTLNSVDELVMERTEEYVSQLDEKMETFESEFNAVASNSEFVQKVAENITNNQNAVALVTVSSGQTLRFNSGTEILLRTGTANFTTGEGVVNITTGTTNQTAIAVNNMYIAVDDLRSLTASSDCTIMVFGAYTLS